MRTVNLLPNKQKMPIWFYKKLNQSLQEELNPSLHSFRKQENRPPHAGATLTPKQAKIIKGSKIMGPAWLTHKHRQIPSEENISKKKKKSIK